MKKLLLIYSFLYFTAVASPTLATECTTLNSCTYLGYVDITSVSCDDGTLVKCPFDANYGICIKNPFGKLAFTSKVTDIDCANPPTCASLGYVDITSASCDDGTLVKCPLDANYGICIANHYEEDTEEEETPVFNCEIKGSGVRATSVWSNSEVKANNPCAKVGGDGGLCMYNDDVAKASGLTTGQIVFLSDAADMASTYKVFNTVNSTTSTTVNATSTMVYYACLMSTEEETVPENTTRPLAECEPGDFIIMPAGSSAFCSTTDITGTNYKVLDNDKTHVFYIPVTADNVNYIPQGNYTTKAQIISAIKVAHPGCYILPNTAVAEDYRIYREFLTDHEIITDDRSNKAIVFENDTVQSIPVFSSGDPQVYICANALRISTGNPNSIPSSDWNASASQNANVTVTCPANYRYTCAEGYTHETPEDYCLNEGSNIKYYKTACTIRTCASQGFKHKCSEGTFNSGEYCTENGVKFYKTPCYPKCGAGQYLNPMSCCSSAQSGVSGRTKASDGVGYCYTCCTKSSRSSVVPPSSDPCDTNNDGAIDLPIKKPCCDRTVFPLGCAGGDIYIPGGGSTGNTGGMGGGTPSQLDIILDMFNNNDGTDIGCQVLGCTVFY